MTEKDFLSMQKQAMNGTDWDRFPAAFWDEVLRREGTIDPIKYGIGQTTMKNSPSAFKSGKNVYRRIFIRLSTPEETLTNRPIKDGEDFACRAAIIENWFNTISRKRNFVLTFYAEEVSDSQAEELEGKLPGYSLKENVSQD